MILYIGLQRRVVLVSSACFLVNKNREIVHFGAVAAIILSDGNAIRERDGELIFVSEDIDRSFGCALSEVLDLNDSTYIEGEAVKVIDSKDFVVTVSRFYRKNNFGDDVDSRDLLAMVQLYFRSTKVISLFKERLRSKYGLTERECGLCIKFIKYPSLERVAVESGITRSTIRTYIKNIYAKTGVDGQSSLMKKLLEVYYGCYGFEGLI